ncbi:MAG TPA: hypothetical protein DD621_03560 [Clostridiales bacterium]|nr:hypothetical protein [Clostridiales bacterium]
MKTRLLTSTYIVIALILTLVSRMLTPYIFDIVIGAMAVMGCVEVGRVFERSKQYNNIYLVGSFPAVLFVGFVIAFVYSFVWQYYLLMIIGLVFAYFIIAFLLTLILKKQTDREMSKYQIEEKRVVYALKKAINSSIILIYPALLFGCLMLINHFYAFKISDKVLDVPFDYYMLITVFSVTIATDSLALVVGKTLKGPKLCPLISPNKTISGAIGGLAGGVLSAFIVYWIYAINKDFVTAFNSVASLWTVAILGFCGSIISQIGDIFASYLKRRARVKDYGTIFPGHGGIMDRVDGLIFNATFVLLYFLFLL